MEKEPTFYSVEEKFKKQIDERFDLWISIVVDSALSEQAKEKIKRNLSDFKDGAFKNWPSLADAFRGILFSILSITERDDNKNEASILFEDLRDDIWSLYKEIQS